jgi:hypothetical protein
MSGTTPKRKPTIAERAMICTKKKHSSYFAKEKGSSVGV